MVSYLKIDRQYEETLKTSCKPLLHDPVSGTWIPDSSTCIQDSTAEIPQAKISRIPESEFPHEGR